MAYNGPSEAQIQRRADKETAREEGPPPYADAMVDAQETAAAETAANRKRNKRIPALDVVKDIGTLALQGGSWNLSQEAAGIRGGAAGLLGQFGEMLGIDVGHDIEEGEHKGERVGLPSSMSEGYDAAYREAQLNIDKARDSLGESGWFLPMLAETAGAIFGGPAGLAKGAYNMGRHSGTFGSRMAEVGRQSLVGGVDSTMAAMFEGAIQEADGDLGTAAANMGIPALLGVVAGGGSQFAFGEIMPAMWKYGLNFAGKGSDEKIGSALLSTGSDKTGLTPENLRANYDLIRGGASMAELSVGDSPNAVIMNRMADSFAEATGVTSKPSLGGSKVSDTDEYIKTMGTIQRIGEEAQANLRETLTDTLGIPDSAYTRRIANNERLEPLRERYRRMASTDVPGKGGDISVNYQPFVERLNQSVANRTRAGKITDIGGFEKEYLAEAIRIARPRAIHPHTKTVYTPKSGVPDPKTGKMEPGSIDLSGAKVKVADLVRARKAMAEKLRPGAMIDGTAQTKERTAAALNVMKSLDDEIGNRMFNNNKELNRRFSGMLQADDAHASGIDFYSHRMANDPDYGKSLKEYTEGLDADSLDSFRTGYKSAMIEAIDANGLSNEMGAFIGKFDPESLSRATHEKFGNIENLRTILGKTEADNFIKEINEKADFLDATERMREVATRKGMSPEAISGIVRDSDALLIAGGFSPSQNTLTANSTLGAIGRKMRALGPRETVKMQRLMNTSGEEGVEGIEKWLKGVESRSELPAGHVGSAVDFPEAYERNRKKEESKEKTKFQDVGGRLRGEN